MANNVNQSNQRNQNNQRNQSNQGNQNNQNNQNGSNDNGLFYGIFITVIGILCLTWMKEDSFRFLGMFTVQCKTLGIILLVIGGWKLLSNDGFGNLVGEILALPFRLLGWMLEYWYVTAAIVALVFWLRPEYEEPVKEEFHFAAATEQTASAQMVSGETEGIIVTPTLPPAKVYIHQPYAGMSREAGICRNLRGDAMLLLVFVNDSSSTWTPKEIQNFIGNVVDPGLDFIVYRASEYGYGISVEKCVYQDDNGDTRVMQYNDTVYDLDAQYSTTDLAERAAETYGFASVTDMIENVRAYAGTDQVGIVFCMDKAGRSYAHRHDSDPDYVEYAMLFSSWKGHKTRAAEVAHEVMHLFGADDMYAEGDVRVNRAALAKKLHPRELYYEYQWNLYDNVVSPYTAYAVGWLDSLPAEYNVPEWWS